MPKTKKATGAAVKTRPPAKAKGAAVKRRRQGQRPTVDEKLTLKRLALLEFAECGNEKATAGMLGLSRTTLKVWRAEDEEFRLAWDEAAEGAVQSLEYEAIRRAKHGTKEIRPIYHDGALIGTEVKTTYSDTLLIFLLKALRPDVYRDNYRIEHSGPDGGPIPVREIIINMPPVEEIIEGKAKVAG